MGALNGEVLPELVNLYKSPFYLATRKDGAAIPTKKLHSKGMLPKDVIFFAPCHVGGTKGREAALASLEAQGFTEEGEALSVHARRGYDGTLDSLVAQGYSMEEAPSENGRRAHDGAVNNLINEVVDPKKASSELSIRNAANHRKAGTCKFLGGCNKAIRTGELCKDHQPIKAEKSDRCQSCGRMLGGEMKVTGGVCNPCYQPEATAARKKAIAAKKEARGTCSTPGCTVVNHNGHHKCMQCLYY